MQSPKIQNRLKDVYEKYFEAVLAETDAQRKSAFRLRYEVYCVEHPYEDPAQNPHEMEIDAYDSIALHALLYHRPSGNLVGTTRLIPHRPGDDKFTLPIRDVCHHELLVQDRPELPWAHTAEISRFAISKNFRRRANEETSVGSFITDANDPRRVIPNTSLGLITAITAMAAGAGLTHLCAAMEPTLLRMLRRIGIYFNPLGPEVDYHGRRQPCYADWDALLARVWLERPDIWEIITSDGALWPLNTDHVATLRAQLI
ncbi:MAG TPA: PEP-CTERM/exosortase system-associated acyltransferase [Micropepsaceae bacterium]|nr:PEP-CTERM/exosortase system-associated acyltransferase [Micropepsaceae bacterium]